MNARVHALLEWNEEEGRRHDILALTETCTWWLGTAKAPHARRGESKLCHVLRCSRSGCYGGKVHFSSLPSGLFLDARPRLGLL